MPTLEEVVNQKVPPEKPLELPDQEPVEQEQTFELNFGWLKTPTGDGPLEQYMDHPFNYNNSLAMARVLRGLTGFIGSLDLAIADIVLGALEFIKGRDPIAKN
jgi:hypothetical protein